MPRTEFGSSEVSPLENPAFSSLRPSFSISTEISIAKLVPDGSPFRMSRRRKRRRHGMP